MESLLEKRKVKRLSLEEIPELETIGELDRIFTDECYACCSKCQFLQAVINGLYALFAYLFIVKIYKFRSKLLIYCMIGQPLRSVNLGSPYFSREIA
jgi:hypothetical protein